MSNDGRGRRQIGTRHGQVGDGHQEFSSRSVPGGDVPAGHRLGEAEALQEVGAEAGELLGLLGRLDTLGDGAEVEVAGQRDDRRGDLGVAVAQFGDERAVHLEAVHRQVPQVGQRRVAGEVVDGELDAEVAQLFCRTSRRLRVLHQGRLGDLDGDPGRVQAVALQSCRHGECRLSSSCRAETLTLASGRRRGPAGGPLHGRRQDSSSTSSPRDMISPLSSASGMKVAGLIGPRSGWFHRASDSTATGSRSSI